MCTMVSKLHFGRVLRRLHFSWQDSLTFAHHDHCRTVHANSILSELGDVVFSFCDFGKIMSKRSAVEEMADTPINKKQHLQIMADSLKSECGANVNIEHRESRCTSTHKMSSESKAESSEDLTTTSAADVFDDSGIEITPNVDRTLTRGVNMPGFLLNRPKTFPAPKFDIVSSDKDDSLPSKTLSHDSSASSETTSRKINSVLEISESSQDRVEREECKHEDISTASVDLLPTSSHSSESEKTCPAACFEQQSNDKRGDKTKSDNSMVAESDAKSTLSKDAEIFVNADKVKSKVSNSTLESDFNPSYKQHSLKEGENVKPVQTKLESLAGKQRQARKLTEEKKQASKTRATKCSSEPALTPKEKKAQQMSTMGKAVQQEKQASYSELKTKKRTSIQKEDGHAKLGTSKADHGRDVKKMSARSQTKSILSPDSKKSKQTVLPAALLNQVVKTVQENVRTISTQILSASAKKSLSPPASVDPAPARKVNAASQSADPASCTKCGENANNSCLTDGDVESSKDLKSDQPMQHGALDTREGETKADDESKPSSPKLLKQCTSNSMSSDQPVENNSNNDRKDKRENCSVLADSSTSLDTAIEKNSNDDTKLTKDKSENLCALDGSQESENTLHLDSVLPVECVETGKSSSCEIQKIKTKAKKKKKKSKRQRKSTGGDHESLLGILPDYIPENDSRVNKKKGDKVYNLEALFSGRLLNNRSTQPRSRPNYFFAIQITNSQITAGFRDVQQAVEEACPKLKLAFVPVETAHLTLGAMHLPDEETVNRAIAAMEEFRMSYQQQKQNEIQSEEERLQEQDQTTDEEHPQQKSAADKEQKEQWQTERKTASTDSLKSFPDEESLETAFANSLKITTADPLTLDVKGLGTFRDDVVFAKVTEGAALSQITDMAERLRNHTLDQNISMDSKPFAPHITLMKMSKNPGKLKSSGIKKIDGQLYQEFSDTFFGSNTVSSIQLCSMLKPKVNKYYHIEHEIPIELQEGTFGNTAL